MTVGSTLKYHRKKANLSQIELAHKLHVSRQSISSWENDHSYPSLDNLIALSRIYQTSIIAAVTMFATFLLMPTFLHALYTAS